MCDTYNYDYQKHSTFRFNLIDFQLYIDFPRGVGTATAGAVLAAPLFNIKKKEEEEEEEEEKKKEKEKRKNWRKKISLFFIYLFTTHFIIIPY